MRLLTELQFCPTSSFGSIAQLGEHLPYKQRVIGSSPIVPTKKTNIELVFSFCFTIYITS